MFGSEWPIADGKWPENCCSARVILFKVEILKIVGGIEQVKLLELRAK